MVEMGLKSDVGVGDAVGDEKMVVHGEAVAQYTKDEVGMLTECVTGRSSVAWIV